jgi:hypothetical protein
VEDMNILCGQNIESVLMVQQVVHIVNYCTPKRIKIYKAYLERKVSILNLTK